MLKKLRLKLTFINMVLVTLVLLIVLAVLLLSSYRKNVSMTREALSDAIVRASLMPGEGPGSSDDAMQEGNPPPFDSGKDPQGEAPSGSNGGTNTRNFREFGNLREGKGPNPFQENYIPTVVVTVADDGSYTTSFTAVAEISEENLSEAVAQVLAQNKNEGLLTSYALRFYKETAQDGTLKIAFADRSHEITQLTNLLLTSLVVGLPALAVLLGISLFLSSLALRPVKAAMDQQRQFTADASHELKTPLAVILANNDILLSHPEKTVQEQMNWIQATKEEGSRMKELIENLLFLAKSDADKLPVTLAEINLSDLVMGSVLTYESVAFESQILIDTDIAKDLKANVDEAKIKQLLMILLDNACKYAPQGSTIQVSLTETTLKSLQKEKALPPELWEGQKNTPAALLTGQKNGPMALLSVNNQGEVISKDALPHLFDRFYRVDNARTQDKIGGYGLGLSIAKTICTLHEGNIAAASTQEKGTTFYVLLPLK